MRQPAQSARLSCLSLPSAGLIFPPVWMRRACEAMSSCINRGRDQSRSADVPRTSYPLAIKRAQSIFRIGNDFTQDRFEDVVVREPQRCA